MGMTLGYFPPVTVRIGFYKALDDQRDKMAVVSIWAALPRFYKSETSQPAESIRLLHFSIVVFDQLVDKTAQEVHGLRAVEAAGLLSSAVSDHCRETAYLVPPGDTHVLVGIHFRQHESAFVFVSQFFQHRPQYAARAAPLRTDIQQHRHVMGTGQDQFVKIGFYYVVTAFHGLELSR
jgi:hypothetical protein